MPQFTPGEEGVAIATFPTKPAGLECTAELWLASNMTKVATSGEIPFTATGGDKSVTLPITLPNVEGTYPVHLEVFSSGLRIATFLGDEDVVIAAPAPPPPFTFSNETVYRKTCPRATGWDVPVYDCRITNPSDKTVTHHIEFWQQGYSHTYGKWIDPRMVTRLTDEPPWDITLGPGQSHNLHYDGWYYSPEDGEWHCAPYIPAHYTIYYWLQDENGNKSRKVSVYRP